MKNKGFTIVEMLSAFILSSIIIIILFELIINLKEIYQSSGIKTELLNKQYLMTNKIYTDLNEKPVLDVKSCEGQNECVSFIFQGGTVKNLAIDETNKTLTYDDYTIKLNNVTSFGEVTIDINNSSNGPKVFNIKVPIYNNLIKDTNFGINIVIPLDMN